MKLFYRMDVSGLMMALLCVLLSAPLSPTWARTEPAEENPGSATSAKKVVLRGRASWYGREHQGHRTSSGERFDRFKYTCAHKTLPFGTRLRVTNPKTGKAVVVRVTDRGPFRHQRILDLAEVAARPLDIVRMGAVSVVAEVVSRDTPLGPTDAPENLAALTTDSTAATVATLIEPGATEAADAVVRPEPTATFIIQAGTYADTRNAQAVQAKIQSLDNTLPVSISATTVDGRSLSRVVVGQFASAAEAETTRLKLQQLGISGLVRQKENM